MKRLLFLLPILFAIEVSCVTGITHLLSMPDDFFVWAGILSICLFLYINYITIIYFTKPKKNEENNHGN